MEVHVEEERMSESREGDHSHYTHLVGRLTPPAPGTITCHNYLSPGHNVHVVSCTHPRHSIHCPLTTTFHRQVLSVCSVPGGVSRCICQSLTSIAYRYTYASISWYDYLTVSAYWLMHVLQHQQSYPV